MNTAIHGGGRRGSIWIGPAIVTALILLIPLVRSLFVNGWDWDLRGFVFVGCVGTLLFGMGLTCQMLIRKLGTPAYRAGVGVALGAALLLFWGNWVQAADDINPDAILYMSVPVVGIIGAAIARFRPEGMARALFVTALAQAVVLGIVLINRNPQATGWTAAVLRGFAGNALFALLFAGSALLFRTAARGEPANAEDDKVTR